MYVFHTYLPTTASLYIYDYLQSVSEFNMIRVNKNNLIYGCVYIVK